MAGTQGRGSGQVESRELRVETGESRVAKFRISDCEFRIFADGGLGIGDRGAISDFGLRISDLRELRFKSETRNPIFEIPLSSACRTVIGHQ